MLKSIRMDLSKLVHRADIDLPLTVGYKRSSNMFYGVYPYKIRLPNFRMSWGYSQLGPLAGLKITRTNELSPEHHMIRNMLGRVDLWLKDMGLKYKQDYTIRRESTVSFFLKDKVMVEAFAAEFKDHIIDIHGPANDAQLDMMTTDEQVVVKNKLWHNKFRWKLTYMGTTVFREQHARIVWDHISRTNPEDFHLSPNFRRAVGIMPMLGNHIYSWSVCSVYCKDQEDTLFLKLATHESLKRIERCVTFKELEQSDK